MDVDDILALLGRLLLSMIFLAAAFSKITGFEATVKYMESYGIMGASFFCALAVAVEALGAIALALGYYTRWSAGLLGAFLIAATFIFHSAPDQRIHLLKNLAILGGLLHVMSAGAGALSMEGRKLVRNYL